MTPIQCRLARTSKTERLHIFFDGEIDETSIYNRALSASDVASIYMAGSAGKCSLAATYRSSLFSRKARQRRLVARQSLTLGRVTAPLIYQWQHDTTNISGATNASLTLTNVSFSEAGSYSVLVTNTAGATNSSNAIPHG